MKDTFEGRTNKKFGWRWKKRRRRRSKKQAHDINFEQKIEEIKEREEGQEIGRFICRGDNSLAEQD